MAFQEPARTYRAEKGNVLEIKAFRICLEINYSECSNARLDFVVPVAMEVITADLHLGKFLVSDFDAGLVGFGIQLGMNLQSCFGGCRRNQIDDCLETAKRLSAPVLVM